MRSRTLWLWLFVGSLGVTAFLGVCALLLPRVVPFEEELLGTSGLLTGYSLLGLMASVAIARGRVKPLPWAGAGLLAISLALWLALLWGNGAMHYRTEENFAKSAGTFLVFGLLPLHASLLLLADFRRPLSKAVRLATIAAACGAGLLIITLFWEMWNFLPGSSRDWIGRFTGALALPAALGTIAIPILARIELVARRDGDTETLGRHIPVRFTCPRCNAESDQHANRRFLCPGCGLQATVTLAEPRCDCGYLLQGLPEPVCPECGRAIAEDRWWRPAQAEPPAKASEVS